MLAFFFTEKHLDENNFSKNIFRTVSDRIFTVIVLEDEHSATITCGFSVTERMISAICLKINIYNYPLSKQQQKKVLKVIKEIPDPHHFC